MTWQNAASIALSADCGTFSNEVYTLRDVLPAASILVTGGTQARITLNGANNNALVIDSAYIGQGAGGGSPSFSGTPTQITFNGSAGVSIPAGGSLLSDAVNFTLNSGDLVVALVVGAEADLRGSSLSAPGAAFYKGGVQDASTVVAAGYTQSGEANTLCVSLVEFLTGGAPPPPPPPPPSNPPGTIPGFVSVPLPRPLAVAGSGWTSPSPLPTNDWVAGSAGSLAAWTFIVADQADRQGALSLGGPYDLFIGDSIMALADVSQFTPYPYQNSAIAGSTVGSLINQLDQISHSQVTPQVNSLGNLHALVVQIGINNIGALGQTAAQIEAQLQQFFTSYTGPLIWSGILPAPASAGWNTEIAAINAWASGYLASRPHTHDISAAVTAALSSGGAMNPSYQLVVGGVAGIHYNGAGCKAWGALVQASLLTPF